MFVLLARDPDAPEAIRHWARIQVITGEQPRPKIDEAFNCANEMDKWRKEKEGEE